MINKVGQIIGEIIYVLRILFTKTILGTKLVHKSKENQLSNFGLKETLQSHKI